MFGANRRASAAGRHEPSIGASCRRTLPRALFDSRGTPSPRLATQIAIDTPDPFINAAVAALNVAADAVWDEPQRAVMHGAVAWRSKLLGWRGPYAMDALGWHDRARRASHRTGHAAEHEARSPTSCPPPTRTANLARNEPRCTATATCRTSHYDMNLVYIDALFRHLLWTGDLEFARQMWPVIERHLAWERRLFRREFGPESLPLYEAYAAIWASDDLHYHGGGVDALLGLQSTITTRMAARLAALARQGSRRPTNARRS